MDRSDSNRTAARPRTPPTGRGTVYLVGAGPGDPGLLTLRAARLLRRAEVVVHDALVGDQILDLIPPGTQRIDVGKRCGGKRTSQEQINDLLITAGRRARTVVRLKGGDPFVFGRGGEEAIALREAGVRFRIVPGITAAVGVSAYAGIPLTHRDFASSVTFVTGHRKTGGLSPHLDWDALARLEGTLVVYMGVRSLAEMASRLIAGGRSPQTPAAVVQWGTHARQRTVTAPLREIPAAAKASGIEAPALVVIGEVAGLRDQLAWFDRLPLRGIRVLIGRSRPQPSRIARALARLGAEVHEYPRLRSAAAPRSLEVDGGFAELPSSDWILFTSRPAVIRFWAEALERGLDARCLAGVKVAALGRATATALSRRGIVADVRTRTFESKSVARELARFGPLDGQRILFPREGHVESAITADLAERGAMVREVEIFRTLLYDSLADGGSAPEVDIVVLPSSTAARSVAPLLAESGSKVRVVAIGPRTAATAEKLGLVVDAIPSEHTVRGIVDSVREIAREVRAFQEGRTDNRAELAAADGSSDR
ncbi:MAG: uroporphyrinogen-III C-methyltransferase [Gemmatimonas sp.]|nr:uroporphyrinogen-III C-methyltransferase [Gemmatimonas sp.]